MKQGLKQASYTLPEMQKKYLLRLAHKMGLTQVQVLRMIINKHMDDNPQK